MNLINVAGELPYKIRSPRLKGPSIPPQFSCFRYKIHQMPKSNLISYTLKDEEQLLTRVTPGPQEVRGCHPRPGPDPGNTICDPGDTEPRGARSVFRSPDDKLNISPICQLPGPGRRRLISSRNVDKTRPLPAAAGQLCLTCFTEHSCTLHAV